MEVVREYLRFPFLIVEAAPYQGFRSLVVVVYTAYRLAYCLTEGCGVYFGCSKVAFFLVLFLSIKGFFFAPAYGFQ